MFERYERWRRFDNVMLAAVTDGLNRLFSNAVPPVKLAHDFGLAIGTIGELQRLVRGERL